MVNLNKIVKLACKPTVAAPKDKYLEPIVATSWKGRDAILGLCAALQPALWDRNVITSFKALLVLHTVMRDGPPLFSDSISADVLRLRSYTSSESEADFRAPENLPVYASYLNLYIRTYHHPQKSVSGFRFPLKRDPETAIEFVDSLIDPPMSRRGSALISARKLQKRRASSTEEYSPTQDETSAIQKLQALQTLVDGLLDCFAYDDECGDPMTVSALHMLIQDLLVLFPAENIRIVDMLDRYFDMSYDDAWVALIIYRRFCLHVANITEYFERAEASLDFHNTGLRMPEIDHAPVTLVQPMREYLDVLERRQRSLPPIPLAPEVPMTFRNTRRMRSMFAPAPNLAPVPAPPATTVHHTPPPIDSFHFTDHMHPNNARIPLVPEPVAKPVPIPTPPESFEELAVSRNPFRRAAAPVSMALSSTSTLINSTDPFSDSSSMATAGSSTPQVHPQIFGLSARDIDTYDTYNWSQWAQATSSAGSSSSDLDSVSAQPDDGAGRRGGNSAPFSSPGAGPSTSTTFWNALSLDSPSTPAGPSTSTTFWHALSPDSPSTPMFPLTPPPDTDLISWEPATYPQPHSDLRPLPMDAQDMSLDRGYPQPVGYLDGWTPPSPSPWRHTSLIDYWTSNFSTDAKTDPDAPHYPEIKRRVPTFECGICLDEQPEEDVACVEPCGHQFCRDCIRSYIRAKVGARQFPIACPTCAVEAGRGRTDPGDIATAFAEQIGLEEDEYQILHELEMSAFSVPVECRRCHASVFVDRDEYQAATTITCPLPRCDFSWCKTCHQEVREDDPHSCDGSAELRRLMEERGWTECPGCHTPVSKTEGCDHMICTTPGCNTHFCYSCGGAMDRNNIHNHVCVEA